MAFSVVLTQIAMLFLIMAAGYAAGKTGLISVSVTENLTALVMKITLPAMILVSMMREFDPVLMRDGLLAGGISLAFYLLSALLASLLARKLKIRDGRRSLWVLSSTLSNCGFIGFPIAYALYGADGFFVNAFINFSFTVVANTVCLKLVMEDAPGGGKVTLGVIFKNALTISTLLGLLLFFLQIRFPAVIEDTLTMVGDLTVPLSMIITGLSITRYRFRDALKDRDAFTSSLLRLLVLPLLLYAMLLPFDFGEGSFVAPLSVIMMAMPAPTLTMLFAVEYRGDTDYAGRVILISSVASLATIPLILLLF